METTKHDVTVEQIENFIIKNMDNRTTPDHIEAMARLATALADLIKARAAASTSDVIISHQTQNNLFSEI